MIEIKNLTKKYNERVVLNGLNISLPNKGFVTLFGASGSGKTTLLNALGGIDRDIDGSISIDGLHISSLNDNEMLDYRLNNIGYIFQNFNLFNLESAYENIKIPLDSSAILSERIKKRRVNDAMHLLGISNLKTKNINQLSGGEKQRVAIARAIINSPKIILCDEPTGSLDETNTTQIFQILKKLSKKMLVVVASHDQSIKKYSDIILNLEDGNIVSQSENNAVEEQYFPPLIGENFVKKKPHLSSRFKVVHAFRKMKSKKFRSLIINGVLSMSLTGIGISLIISLSLSSKIKNAFSSLTNGNQIVMNLKQDNQNTVSTAYSAPSHMVEAIHQKYESDIEGVGATYLVNFENFFKDRNNFYLSSTSYKVDIPSLSTRNINDYRWLNNESPMLLYPYTPTKLENDELILGLNYVDMVNICFKLQIQRNYYSLGEYARTHDLTITLEVRNSYWQYDDEQLFKVVAVTETNKSCFYHYNQRWNEAVFEDMMRLPSDDDGVSIYPWEMYKIYYFKTYEDPSVFINKTFYDPNLYDFVFERVSYSYNPLICKSNEVCREKRVFIYFVDKNAINAEVVNKVSSLEKGMDNYYFISDYGYASYASNMLSGFSKNVYMSLSENLLNQTIDADSSLDIESDLNVSLLDGVVGGNYLKSLSGGLKFSTKPKEFISGRMPAHNKEIAISKGLNEKLGGNAYGKELYISGVINEYLNNDNSLQKDYYTAKVVVTGIVNENATYIYHDNDWTISFFRDELGISMFNLIPKAVVFELDEKADSEKICDRFNKIFSNYTFSSPTVEISKSIGSTLSYANTILIAFSVLATIISVLLLSTVVMLNVIESKDELNLFYYLGIRIKDSQSTFVVQSLLHGLVSFALAAIEIVLVDVILSKKLGDMVMASVKYQFNPLPLLIVFGISIFVSAITSYVVVKLITKKKRGDKNVTQK
ncbi:MAG: ABC transporter ATP-binding protein [Bacilli bacterium]|nr:ABC transporter ATP-binding protein [Bacilli bacterium]